MLGIYFRTAIRNIRKHAIYSFINIIGLACGFAVCCLIILWVNDELSFDRQHQFRDSIFRLTLEQDLNGKKSYIAATPGELGPELLAAYPEIDAYCRLDNKGGWQFRYSEGEYIVGESALTEPSFFDFFGFGWLAGNLDTAFDAPRNIILTESFARKLFGEIEPLGQSIQMKVLGEFTVAGIMEDVHHSHLQLDFIIPFTFLRELGIEIPPLERSNLEYITYLKLKPNTDYLTFDTKIKHFLDGRIGDGIFSLILQPLPDVYLKGRCGYDPALTSDSKYIFIFSIIAVMVLVIACINFINLTTARSTVRAKEIGMRKVSGAGKSRLIIQFLGESLIMAVIAMLIALILVELLLQDFNLLSGKEFAISTVVSGSFFLWLIGLVVITGFLAGLYPAFYLTAYQPVDVLKGQLTSGRKGWFFRRLLVIGQFTISIILIISALTISAQMKYISNKNLGFDRELLAHVVITRAMREDFDHFKDKISRIPGVNSMSVITQIPAGGNSSTPVLDWDGNDGEEMYRIFLTWTDPGFLETFGIDLLEGENFTESETGASTDFVIVNETAVREMNMTDPLGKKLLISALYYQIRGVVKDFHVNTLHQQMTPLAIIYDSNRSRHLFVRLAPGTLPDIIEKLDGVVKEVDPTAIEGFRIFDETLDSRYDIEIRTGRLVSYFTFLAIFISCLGLFGLASFTTEQRLREICIRKVMGASASQLLVNLSQSFIRWILLANILAWPLAYYVMNKWLQNFSYRIDIDFVIMASAALISVLIGSFTIVTKTLKAVHKNPVKILRYE